MNVSCKVATTYSSVGLLLLFSGLFFGPLFYREVGGSRALRNTACLIPFFFTALNIDGAVFLRESLTKKAFIFNLRVAA